MNRLRAARVLSTQGTKRAFFCIVFSCTAHGTYSTRQASPRWVLLAFFLAISAIGSPPRASAQSDPDPEAKRLIKLRDAERYEVKRPNSRIRAGGARVHVRAPLEVVRRVVTDFNNYARFIHKFKQSRIVGKKGKRMDVYLQVPILKGAANIWAVVRVAPPKASGQKTEIMRGSMIKGNVERLDAVWRLKKIDERNTQLNLELHIVPKLPVPGSLVTGEVAYAADEAVIGLRNRSEALAKSGN